MAAAAIARGDVESPVLAKYILGLLAIVFLVAGTFSRAQIQGRTWLLVGTIFAVISGWLFMSSR